jgi:hypothetical protein
LATSSLRLTTSNFIFKLTTCCYSPYVTFPLTRGWVCRLQLLLVLASAVIFRSESHILLSQIRDSPNLEGQVRVFRSSRKRVGPLYPQALGSLFVASYDSQSYGVGIRSRFTRDEQSFKLCPVYNPSAQTAQKIQLFYFCVRVILRALPSNGRYL